MIRPGERLSFLAFVIDAFSRRVVGWQHASHMRTDLVLDALRMALGMLVADRVWQTRSQLGLEAVDERLGKRVVVGVADRADRGRDAVVVEGLGVVDRRVLAAAVGVVDEADVGAGRAWGISLSISPTRAPH